MASTRTRRAVIEAVISDLAGAFLYYDRKECEDLPMDAIQEAVASGEITLDEIIAQFRSELAELEPKGKKRAAPSPQTVTIERRDHPDDVTTRFIAAINKSGYAHAEYGSEGEDNAVITIGPAR